MASRYVTSPAGERIRVYPDDEWSELEGAASPKGMRQWTGLKPAAIMLLWVNGEYRDESGRATTLLLDDIKRAYPRLAKRSRSALSVLVGDPSNAIAFKRDGNTKRTHGIKLVAMPEIWYAKLTRDLRAIQNVRAKLEMEQPGHPDEPQVTHSEPEPAIEPIPEIADEVPSASLLEPTTPILDVSMASQVAMELLTQVVGIISKGDSTQANAAVMRLNRDLETAQARLAERLAENTALRKRLTDAGDRITALQVERNGLAQRLRATEANLTAALKGDSLAAVNDTITKAINGIMRAPSTAKAEP